MSITIIIDGQEKTFTLSFISSRKFRRSLEMKNFRNNSTGTVEDLDKMVDYVVDLFDGKFTRDQFYDGVAAKAIMPTILKCMDIVISETYDSITAGADPNE